MTAQIQTAYDCDNETAEDVSVDGDIEGWVDAAEVFGEGEAVVAREGPAEAGLPGVACDEAPDACGDDEGF